MLVEVESLHLQFQQVDIALWDIRCKQEDKPLWQVTGVKIIDVTHIEVELTWDMI